MHTEQQLRATLTGIDGRSYKAYKDIRGGYQFQHHQLFIDHVQGDPFAAPSKVRLRVSLERASIPAHLHNNKIRRIALQDYIARLIEDTLHDLETVSGSGKSGVMRIDVGRQAVIERSAVLMTDAWVEARLEVGLPARGRAVLGRQASRLLCEQLSIVVEDALDWDGVEDSDAEPFVNCIENQAALRDQLSAQGLVAFVANGAILPRRNGASDQPLDAEHTIPFQSPTSMGVTLEVPNPIPTSSGASKSITGMGIRQGITLIVGGGYHGKSTLLQALEQAVYFHLPGDGREYVVTHPDAVKIRAEDGRRVEHVDISPFINNLPMGQNTRQFCTEDASGSTSQAANIMEALEVGCPLLLLDEDTSSTNFMIRDTRMQALVHQEDEPITPFIDRIRAFYDDHGVSTILVMGGCGDYFAVADTVIMMKAFVPKDVTHAAHAIMNKEGNSISNELSVSTNSLHWNNHRIPKYTSIDASKGRHDCKIDAKGTDSLMFGRTLLELRGLAQLTDCSQTRAIGYAMWQMRMLLENDKAPLSELLDQLETRMDEQGIDCLNPKLYERSQEKKSSPNMSGLANTVSHFRSYEHPGNLARPRRFEIAAALNRLRTLSILQGPRR